MFLKHIEGIENNIAIADAFGREYTYGQLENLSCCYEKMIPKRSIVLILCDYDIETVALYYSLINSHIVPMLVDKQLDKGLLQRLIMVYEPQYIWGKRDEGDSFMHILMQEEKVKETHILWRTKFSRYAIHEELALLMTTSGSTGSSKLVRVSYTNLLCNMEAFIRKIGLQKEDKAITTMPMQYCYGLSILHMHWLIGASVYVTEYTMLDVKFWEFFEKSEITNFAGVSYIYEILFRIGFFDREYPSLRFLTQAGDKLAENRQIDIADRMAQKGKKFFTCYGQTEATTYISVLPGELLPEKAGSVGQPLDNIQISIGDVDENGIGELICRSKGISLGYALNKNELNQENSNEGFLKTGDCAYVDEDNNIFLKGRLKRVVKMLGARISLDEIEQVLKRCYNEAEFACVGKDNSITIFYVSSKILEEELRLFCIKKFGLQRKMIYIKKVDCMPRNESGKVLYAQLQETTDGKRV